jgi:hypothetical protein
MHDDGAKGPSDDAERAAAIVGTIVAASTSPKAVAAPNGDAVPALDEDAHATESTGGPLEAMHQKWCMQLSSKPRCLPPAPQSAKPPLSLWAPSRLNLRSSLPKPRSKGP